MTDEQRANEVRAAVETMRKVLFDARRDGLLVRLSLKREPIIGIQGRDHTGHYDSIQIDEVVRPL
ncbi:MAG TPA: hypothetical protein VF475_14650 [Sphingobium sp.]